MLKSAAKPTVHGVRQNSISVLNQNRISKRFIETEVSTKPGELKFSYLKNPVTTEPLDVTIGHFLSNKARSFPHANAVRVSHQDIMWTNQDLKKHIEALACGMVELGVRPGDRVGIIQGATAEIITTQLACAKIGAIMVPFQEAKNVKTLERYMQLFRPRILMMPSQLGNTDYKQLINEIWPHFGKAVDGVPVRSNKYPFCKRIILTDRRAKPQPGQYRFEEVLLYGPFGYYESPLRRIALGLKPEDPAVILTNSTDINKAKPVVFSHKNLLNAGLHLGLAGGVKSGDRVLIPGYQSALMGTLANYTSLVSGATMVIPVTTWNTEEVLRLTAAEQCSAIFASAEDYERMLSHPDLSKHDFSGLKTAYIESSTPEELQSEIKNKLGIQNVVLTSGQLEQTGITQINGSWLPGSEVKIVRQEDNKIVQIGSSGSLRIKGPHCALGYWNDLGLQRNETDDTGFFITNKDAQMDQNGNVTIVGNSAKQVSIVL